MNDDERLKRGFARLRDADARRAPPLDAMLRARPRRRTPWVVAAPIASVAAAAAAVFLLLQTRHDASAPNAAAPAPPAAVAGARATTSTPTLGPAPLDFLLNVPGQASLSTIPDFDRSLLQGRR